MKKKEKFKLWKEILTEVNSEGKRIYSQGRIYLLWSVLAYYLTLGLMTLKSLKPEIGIDIEVLKTIIEALQWPLSVFSGYVFGTKGLEAFKIIMSKGGYKTPAEEKDSAATESESPEI